MTRDQALPIAERWHDAKSDPPGLPGWYLVWAAARDEQPIYWYAVAWYTGGEWMTPDQVSRWHPVPEPPEDRP